MRYTHVQKIIIWMYFALILFVSVLWVPHKIEGVNALSAASGGGETIVRFDAGRTPIWFLPKDNGDIYIGNLDTCGVSLNYQGVITEVFILTLLFGCLFLLVTCKVKSSTGKAE